LGLVITNGRPIFNLGNKFTDLASGFTLGIPNLVYFLIAVLSLGIFILTKTVFGKRVYAIGGNEDAARFSGINTKKIKLQVYMISGFLAGLCGVLLASRITSGNPTVADGYELDAIAAAVIGGVSMSGGSGNLFGTLIGALIIGVINNGLDILAVSPFYQKVIQGLIIATAIYLDTRVKKRN
jgi:ribose/xylose/arabinose/galactoside ABC-type transport system permease subunit